MGFISAIAASMFKKEVDNLVDSKFDKLKAKLKESSQSPAIGREDIGWRPITKATIKELSPLEQYKMQKVSYFLYDKNGIAHRMIERYKDFVIGDGITFSCSVPEVYDILRNFWDANNLTKEQEQWVLELSLYGEQVYPTFVQEHTGFVTLGYLDPVLISKIETDTDDARIRTKLYYTNDPAGKEIEKKIINLDDGYLRGETFFFTINNVSNATRGRSDLFPLADGLDAYENFLYNRAERADIMNRIIYDLKMEGKSSEEIKAYLRDFTLPEPSSVFGHNEKTELSIKVPELASDDASKEAKLLFSHFLAGSGFPGHWFSDAEGITRATALSMDLATKKQLKSRQRYLKYMMSYIFRYVIHQFILHKNLDEKHKDVPVQINIPRIEEKELEMISSSLINLANSLTVASEEGWVSQSVAGKVFKHLLNQIGLELEKEEEKVEVEEGIDPKLRDIYSKKREAVEVVDPTIDLEDTY